MPQKSGGIVQPADFDKLDTQSREVARSEASEAERHQRRIELEDLRWLMSDKRGRRFMRNLLSKSGVYRTSFTGDRATTDFREGERNVGLRFLHDTMEACPDRYVEMLQEQHEDDDSDPGRKPTRKRRK